MTDIFKAQRAADVDKVIMATDAWDPLLTAFGAAAGPG